MTEELRQHIEQMIDKLEREVRAYGNATIVTFIAGQLVAYREILVKLNESKEGGER